MMRSVANLFALAALAALAGREVPPAVAPPGDAFELPPWPSAAAAPQIYECGREAGPDETLFLVGTNLTRDVCVWGAHPDNPAGKAVRVAVQLATETALAVTIPDSAYDGPLVLTVKNAAGYAVPVVVNAPEPWWASVSGPQSEDGCLSSSCRAPRSELRVFGRNLACRPDGRKAFAWLADSRGAGRWLEVVVAGKYALSCALPKDVKPGTYELWLHGGRGGAWGWGGPLRVEVPAVARRSKAARTLSPGDDVQAALEAMAARGGGTVRLSAGRYPYAGTLRIPAEVALVGAGRDCTTLELQTSPPASFARLESSGWGIAPNAIHARGDSMAYDLKVPQDGRWAVWMRYGTDMSPWKLPGVSSNSTLQVDGGAPVVLANLPNTGGFGVFKWKRAAEIELPAGRHALVWRNTGGGGLSLDAFVFVRAGAEPSDQPLPTDSPACVVVQGESCVRFESKEGSLPHSGRAAVWLSGDRAAVSELTVLGNSQVNQGLAIRAPEALAWVTGCRVSGVRVAECEGKQGENCGVFVRQLRGGSVAGCELWGRTPLFLSGARASTFADNRLVSVTRFGGNSEAAILGRCEPVEHCVVERNTIASPPGAGAGGPTARRLLWFSTGHGSVVQNWIAHNGVESAGQAGQARFGGVAGTDQNVGEMILFEGNHRTMFFGPVAGADAWGVTLPATLPETPDARLGSVRREQLAHDAQGRETPFWPPASDDGSAEPPLGEYFVTVFSGPGQGQTRRVVGREGERLTVDRPWRAAPRAGSVVAVGTMFYQNLVVGNHTPDGMTGVQLWISCVENVVADNTVERQRKPGLFLYANGSTLASSMPRTWNRGISPLFWNVAEGNRAEACSDGALVTSGDGAGLPIEFPRALGNVLRHNSFVASRQNGVILTSRKRSASLDPSASVVGTVVEFNVVRDAPVAYHVGEGADLSVVRRNHAYNWSFANDPQPASVALQVDAPESQTAFGQNTAEGRGGVKDATITELRKAWEAK